MVSFHKIHDLLVRNQKKFKTSAFSCNFIKNFVWYSKSTVTVIDILLKNEKDYRNLWNCESESQRHKFIISGLMNGLTWLSCIHLSTVSRFYFQHRQYNTITILSVLSTTCECLSRYFCIQYIEFQLPLRLVLCLRGFALSQF